jgi:hypothetical protein
VLVEGEYVFAGDKNEAKRKALELLLRKSGGKVKAAMEKPKQILPSGVFCVVRE